jgi:hypothetical protein
MEAIQGRPLHGNYPVPAFTDMEAIQGQPLFGSNPVSVFTWKLSSVSLCVEVIRVSLNTEATVAEKKHDRSEKKTFF